MVTLRELLNKALLSIPETEEILTLDSIQKGSRFRYRSGVYIFFTNYNEPLYVGISNSLGKRVVEHIYSKKGNADIKKYVNAGKDLYCTVFYEEDRIHQEIYESYLIKILNPRYNVGKTGRQRV